ncbi:hypothetical protein ASPCADRAFT_128143 [Aspergillus carbonarius ITEM 5010]|uniref:Uncharacterized protein n=1 Tax=Aspergillus carbonarius (strain ITEM 5010) TaxID=602072 RepID=A0A1R3RU23_ASPC5|nr:hypothetical protein ASPCADRAFT_128143 [Aspergillus carbonarius ITEM 5010]
MPSTTASATVLSVASEAQSLDVKAFLGFFAQLKDLSPTVGFNMILAVHEENNALRGHLKSQEEQITGLKNKLRDCEWNKEVAMKEMFAMNEKERRNHHNTQIQMQELQNLLQVKEDCIKEKTAALDTKDVQLTKAKAEFKKQTESLVQAHQEISALQGNLKAKFSIIDQLKGTETGLKDKLSTAEEKVKVLGDKNLNLQQLLNNTRARLDTVEGFSAGYFEGDENPLIDNFTNLWQFAKTELHSQLKVDFSADAISNGPAWAKLKHCDIVRTHQIPIPCSNTQAAKQIRLAIILAVLAREIDRHIFQPCYITPEDTRIREILVELAVTNSEKESFCRSLLHSINVEAQEKALSLIIQTVVSRVLSYLENLLTETQRTSMHASLERIVQKAAEVWQPIRRAKKRYEPDFEQPGTNEYWLPFTLAENDRPEAQTVRDTQDEHALTIFPRLSVIEEDTVTTHTVVIQLGKSSSIVCAASSEMAKAPPNSSVVRVMAKSLVRSRSANSKGAHQPDGHPSAPKKANGK